MATHRKLEKSAGTGERSGSLDHFTFRVWVQYILSADDFGVCEASATKFRGDNPVLREETEKRVQAAIEALVAARLVATFMDGKTRFLYQPDWNTYQQLKYATKTALPPVPEKLLVECCLKTQELFAKFHPKVIGKFFPRGNQDQDRNQDQDQEQAEKPPAPPAVAAAAKSVQGRGAFEPGSLQRDHKDHALCGKAYRLCLSYKVFGTFEGRYGGTKAEARTALQGFVDRLEAEHQSIGDYLWLDGHFTAFLRQAGRLKDAPRDDVARDQRLEQIGSSHDRVIRDIQEGKFARRG